MAKARATKRPATKRAAAHVYPGTWTPGEPGEPRWIAETCVAWIDADGTRRPGRIAIAAPEPHPDASSSCMVLVDCREPRARAIYGADHLQALVLALQLAGTELHQFSARGGRVLSTTGDDLALEPYFGPLLRAAKSAR